MTFLKIKIHHAQNVGKVQISRNKKNSRPHLEQFQYFSMGGKNVEKKLRFFAISLGGPMGPIQPVWGNGCNISPATCMWQALVKAALKSLGWRSACTCGA